MWEEPNAGPDRLVSSYSVLPPPPTPLSLTTHSSNLRPRSAIRPGLSVDFQHVRAALWHVHTVETSPIRTSSYIFKMQPPVTFPGLPATSALSPPHEIHFPVLWWCNLFDCQPDVLLRCLYMVLFLQVFLFMEPRELDLTLSFSLLFD